MGLKDPHDPRPMTHFAKLNPDGTVAAIVEVADSAVQLHHPSADGSVYVDVTDLRAQKIDPMLVVVKDKALLADAKAKGGRDHAALKAYFEAEAFKQVGFLAQADHGRSQ